MLYFHLLCLLTKRPHFYLRILQIEEPCLNSQQMVGKLGWSSDIFMKLITGIDVIRTQGIWHPSEYRTFCESVKQNHFYCSLVPNSVVFLSIYVPFLLQPYNKVECGHLIRPSVANLESPQKYVWNMDSFYLSLTSNFHVFNGCFPYIKGGVPDSLV